MTAALAWTDDDWSAHVATFGRPPALPCDRCMQVRHVFPNRPGELLCSPCRGGARRVDHHERTTR